MSDLKTLISVSFYSRHSVRDAAGGLQVGVRLRTRVRVCVRIRLGVHLCVWVCVILQADAICIFYRAALASVLRYLHVDLISMVTRGKRAARRRMTGGKCRHPDTNRWREDIWKRQTNRQQGKMFNNFMGGLLWEKIMCLSSHECLDLCCGGCLFHFHDFMCSL